MKNFLTGCLFFIYASTFAQISLRDSAESFLFNKDYIHAIPLYQKLAQRYPKDWLTIGDIAFCYMKADSLSKAISLYKRQNQLLSLQKYPSPSALEYLGMCYIKMDSIQAKAVLNIAIKTGYPLRDIPVHCCKMLADIYYKEKDYHRAIAYIELYAKLFETAKFDDVNWFAFNYRKAADLFKCYKGLKLKDSAVNISTPYVFSTWRSLGFLFQWVREPNNVHDSLKHDSICRSYLSLLQTRHSNKNIKSELKKADAEFDFFVEDKPQGKDSLNTLKMATAKIIFYGKPVTISSFGVILQKDEFLPENYKQYFTREYYLNLFHQLPLYQMITHLY